MFNVNPKIRALLLASSPYHARRDFYVHEEKTFRKIFGITSKVLFIPFALKNHSEYALYNKNILQKVSCDLESLHEHETTADKRESVRAAEGIFIGGGNTFRLLAALHRYEIFELLQEKIAQGTPYIGTSAGATLFCPTIKTTNDMPIVELPNLRAFNFLPFQINPHFPDNEIMGAAETRSDRLREFHEENDEPVLGMREGGVLAIQDGKLSLGGEKPAVLFQKNQQSTPQLLYPCDDFQYCLNSQP